MRLSKRNDGKYEFQILNKDEINVLSQSEFDELVDLIAVLRKTPAAASERATANVVQSAEGLASAIPDSLLSDMRTILGNTSTSVIEYWRNQLRDALAELRRAEGEG